MSEIAMRELLRQLEVVEGQRDRAMAAIEAWAIADEGTIGERQSARETLHAFLAEM